MPFSEGNSSSKSTGPDGTISQRNKVDDLRVLLCLGHIIGDNHTIQKLHEIFPKIDLQGVACDLLSIACSGHIYL